MVISPPPAPSSGGKARPCLSATVVPIAPSSPSAAPEAAESTRLISSPLPVVVVEVPAAPAQLPVLVPVALPATVVSPMARISTPPPVQPPSVIVTAPKTEDASAPNVSSVQPVSIPSFLPHVMPALSALAARSVKSPATSKASPTPPHHAPAPKAEAVDTIKSCKEEAPSSTAAAAPAGAPVARLSPVPLSSGSLRVGAESEKPSETVRKFIPSSYRMIKLIRR